MIYRGMEIKATEFGWAIYRDNRFYLADSRTIDGGELKSEKHAINDAKKNIDTILRLDYLKYYASKDNDRRPQ